MEIFLYSNIPEVVHSLQKYYFQFETPKIKFFSAFETKLQSASTIIILEPFRIKNIYFIISPLWKRYLSVHTPDTKLVVLGFCEYQGDNYIDILNFPDDFIARVKNARSVSSNWDIPIDGADMLKWIEGFFEGHGGSSVMSKLNELHQTIDIASQKLIDGSYTFDEIKNDLLLPYAIPEWQELMSRWQYYFPLFQYLPFYPTIQEIQGIFSDLSENFACFFREENLLLKKQINVKIKQVSQKLTEIDRLYIRSYT